MQTRWHDLRQILLDHQVGDCLDKSLELNNVLSGLEGYLSRVLGEVHREWRSEESLDGIYPIVVRVSRPLELEVFGLGILISDQSLTPLYFRIQFDETADEVCSCECKLGETNSPRNRYSELSRAWNRAYLLRDQLESIDWQFQVAFGK